MPKPILKTSVYKTKGRFTFRSLDVTAREQLRGVKRPSDPEFRYPGFIYHFDEFARHVTIISPERTQRPMPSPRAGTLEEAEAFRLYMGNPEAGGEDRRLQAARLTTSPGLLTHILKTQNETPAVLTAAANNPMSPPELREKGCHFCDYEGMWGMPRQLYDDLTMGYASNPFPYAPQHDVHIVNAPVHNLSEMVENPVCAMDLIRLAFRRSREIYQQGKAHIENMFWGMNYGTGRIEDGVETLSAFASFQHIHTQLTAIPRGSYNPGSVVKNAMRARGFKEPFFKAYLSALEGQNLVIRKYEGPTYLVAPWSQQFRDHMRIIAPVPNFQVEKPGKKAVEGVALAFADGLKIMHGLGVRSFNAISFPGPMKSSSQKLVLDLIPRGKPALCEMGGLFVVDSYPETTAEAARKILAG